MENAFDTIVIGGGPAGYTAAMYCARAGLSVAVLEKLGAGGQMATTDRVDNYPGFSQGTEGYFLAEEMKKQAERFGAQSKYEEAVLVDMQGKEKLVRTAKREYRARSLILATGASPRQLGLAGEQELRGKGISYCAACDGAFFRGKETVVVGGGDAAATDAIFLSKLCKKVTVVHRRDKMRAAAIYQKALLQQENVELIWNCTPEELIYGDRLAGLRIKNKLTGEYRQIDCDAVFIAIGNVPNTELFKGQVELTPQGYLAAGEDTKTGVDGVFAAGDVRGKPLRQIVTAVADGAVAAYMAEEYLSLE